MVDGSANDRNRQEDTKGYEDNDYEIDATVLSVRRRILSCHFGNIYRGMQQFLSFNPIYSKNDILESGKICNCFLSLNKQNFNINHVCGILQRKFYLRYCTRHIFTFLLITYTFLHICNYNRIRMYMENYKTS